MLQGLGLSCHQIDSVTSAIAELKTAAEASTPFGLIIIEHALATQAGKDYFDRLRQAGAAGQRLAIIVSTADDQEAVLSALDGQPVDGLLGKPATPSSLFDSIVSALHREPTATPRLPATPGQSASFAGRRVLLVEDNEVNRELGEEMLRAVGLTVDLAENGEQAIASVQLSAYDLVLMDCQMPVMDGYEATRQLRRDARFANLPIIAMTANAQADDRRRCLEAGMNDHIAKPIDVALLYATIGHWLGQAGPALATGSLPAATGDIDINAAIARLGGNRQTYDRLLSRFRDNQSDAMARLNDARQTGDTAGMMLIAHTLRGLAGSLGAVRLAEVAGILEGILRQGSAPDSTAIAEQLDRLGDALATFFTQLPAAPTSPGIPVALTPDPAQQAKALSDLQSLLDNDDATAVRHSESMAGWLGQLAAPGLTEQLLRQIGRYEFEEALSTLHTIRNQLTS